jgi:hypothetical protein
MSRRLMPPKFGHYLFRNLKGQAPGLSRSTSGDLADAFGDLSEQTIILCREDIRADAPGAPELHWSKVDQGKIAVKLKDTQGMLDGSTRFRLPVRGFLENGSAPGRSKSEAESGRGRKVDRSGF